MEFTSKILLYGVWWLLPCCVNGQPYVRVLLAEKTEHDDKKWEVTAPGHVALINAATGNKSHKTYKKIVIDYRYGSIYINNRQCPFNSLLCEPCEGHIYFNGKPFDGFFSVVLHNGNLLFINHVGLEDYVCSVLRTESWPGWPCEVNKVLAVASRSYALAKMMEKKKAPYHVQNTNKDQTYQGVHGSSVLRDAVDQTSGIFLSYKKKPILAMFDSCCGGIIPANIRHFDFSKMPYLKRTNACTACASCSIFNWQVTYTAEELAQLVQPVTHRPIKAIREATITSKDTAGIVQELIMHADNGTKIRLARSKIYSLLKHIKSYVFTISKKGKQFVFKGAGYGHHVGLCQWGSRELVQRGWDYQRILDFYYPHTTLMKVKEKMGEHEGETAPSIGAR